MRAMTMAILECELYDLKSVGSFYTWNNKHEHEGKVLLRVVRVLVRLLVVVDGRVDWWLFGQWLINGYGGGRNSPFKYYNMWSKAQEFDELILNGWGQAIQGTEMFKVVIKLKRLKKDLRKLNSEQFSDIENLARVAELSLAHFQTKLREDPLNEELCNAEKACSKEVEFLSKVKTEYLKQKAKVKWMNEGDDNSAFFHSSIKRRRAMNKVYQVKDMRGNLCTQPNTIKVAFEEFYISLSGTSKLVTPVKAEIVKQGKCLTKQHIKTMLAPVTYEEV
ncbi:uncharacterized protein LOC141651606 [Silene latifolia]|uniref:uncharacterized protein LOC141651606 n=1 Tax=Silene latifolia TaxID=37657 RepID=UPI003D7850E4